MLICLYVFLSWLQKLAGLLYKAAADDGYVDPYKVEQILGVRFTSSAPDETITGQCTCLSVSQKRPIEIPQRARISRLIIV